MMPEHAVKAYTELDGTAFCGRMLHLLPAKTEKVDDDDDGTSLCCVNYSTNMGLDDLNALNYNNIGTSSENKSSSSFKILLDSYLACFFCFRGSYIQRKESKEIESASQIFP